MVASGAAARALLAQLAARMDAQGLRLAAAPGMLVLLGDGDRLPWIDGARYCAPDPDARGLWLPTTLQPDLPAELLHAALQRRGGRNAFLVWPEPELVLPLDDTLPLAPSTLQYLEGVFA